MCTVIFGLFAIKFESAHQGYLTPMTFHKFIVSYQQNLESDIYKYASLPNCMSEPQDFYSFSCFREMEAHDLILNQTFQFIFASCVGKIYLSHLKPVLFYSVFSMRIKSSLFPPESPIVLVWLVR